MTALDPTEAARLLRMTPGPTDDECTELIYRITNERWDESAVKGWFADVTARIEREEGK